MALPDPVTWLKAQGRWTRAVLGIALGCLLTLGHAPLHLPWIAFLAVPAMVWMLAASDGWAQAAWAGWAVGFGYFVSGLHWIGHAFLVDPDRFLWLLPFAVTLLPAFLALFWSGAFALARLLAPASLAGQVIALATCLTAVEYARAHVLTGFPWALPGYIWVETPVAQVASWAGPFGLTLFTLVIPGMLASLPGPGRWPVLPALAAGAALFAWGAERIPLAIQTSADQPVIRVVQPNAPQHLKWDPDYIPLFYRRLMAHSAADGPLGTPDAVIWPEAAVGFVPANEPEAAARIAETARAPVILGAMHPSGGRDGGIFYNALATVLADGALGPRYDKHHLVPFGEYLPIKGLLEAVGLRQLAQHGGAAFGPGPRTISLPGLPPFAAAICYEMIFPHLVVASGPRPAWIVTITNDAWFGGFAGPQQHLDQARFRAIEQGLPVARSANTGISTVIDPFGRIEGTVPLHRDGFWDQRLPNPLPPTLYSRTGDLPTLVLLLVILGNLIWIRRLTMRFDNSSV